MARTKKTTETAAVETTVEVATKKEKAPKKAAVQHQCCCKADCKSTCKNNFAIGHDARLKGLLLKVSRGEEKFAIVWNVRLAERMPTITFLQEAPYKGIIKAAIAEQPAKRTRASKEAK